MCSFDRTASACAHRGTSIACHESGETVHGYPGNSATALSAFFRYSDFAGSIVIADEPCDSLHDNFGRENQMLLHRSASVIDTAPN